MVQRREIWLLSGLENNKQAQESSRWWRNKKEPRVCEFVWAKIEGRERGREFSWGGLKRRENDEKVRVLGRYLGKVRVTHHIGCMAHVMLRKFWLCGPLWITYNKCDLSITKLSCILCSYWINLLCSEKIFLKFLWCNYNSIFVEILTVRCYYMYYPTLSSLFYKFSVN